MAEENEEKQIALTLSNAQREVALGIIAHAEAEIERVSLGDEDVAFRMRRFVHARLQLRNRGTTQKREKLRRDLFGRQHGRCAICGESFTEIKGTHLHRIGPGGYTLANTQLVHEECHQEHHAAEGESLEGA